MAGTALGGEFLWLFQAAREAFRGGAISAVTVRRSISFRSYAFSGREGRENGKILECFRSQWSRMCCRCHTTSRTQETLWEELRTSHSLMVVTHRYTVVRNARASKRSGAHHFRKIYISVPSEKRRDSRAVGGGCSCSHLIWLHSVALHGNVERWTNVSIGQQWSSSVDLQSRDPSQGRTMFGALHALTMFLREVIDMADYYTLVVLVEPQVWD